MHLGQQRVLLFHVERGFDLVHQRVGLRVVEVAPVHAVGGDVAAVHKAGQRVERVRRHVAQVDGGDAFAGRHVRLGPRAPVGVEVFQLDHFKLDVDADFSQALLHVLVHRQRQHLAGAALGNDDLGLERLGLGVTRLRHQRQRLGHVVLDVKRRFAKPGAGLVDLPLGRGGQAIHELDDLVAVDGQVGGFAHADVRPRGAGQRAEVVRPDVRRDVGHHLEATFLQLRDRVRRRGFDQIDLAIEQRVHAGQCFRNRQQDDAVGFGHALGVPVRGVFDQLGALTRHQFVEFEGARA